MATINIILVRSSDARLTLVPLPWDYLELWLDVDSETALEGVRNYFFRHWGAKVHALSWLFPEDFFLPASHVQLPFLVLCVDEIGDLSANQVRHLACNTSGDNGSKSLAALLAAATRPYRAEPWSLPGWLPRISQWIQNQFPQTQRISQVRSCPNGAVLKIDTINRIYYLKEQLDPLAYESSLLRILNRRIPGACPVVVPLSPDANTHVTEAISGFPVDARYWGDALRDVARIQIESTEFVHEFDRAGLPHHDPGVMATHAEEILTGLLSAQKGSPNELTSTEVESVMSLVCKTGADLEALCRCDLPNTLVHADLNQSNAFKSTTGGTVLLDWASARVSHPFFILASALFARYDCNGRADQLYKNLCNAYLEPWRDFQTDDRLQAALDAASRLFWIDSAMAMSLLCRPGHIRNLMNLPRFLRAALRAYCLIP